MKEFARLLRYSRPYFPFIFLSVLLMAAVGAAQALTALLIGPIFDRVFRPQAEEPPVVLFTDPIWHRTIYLNDLMPHWITSIGNMIAVAILAAFFIKGLCDYFGNYFIN